MLLVPAPARRYGLEGMCAEGGSYVGKLGV